VLVAALVTSASFTVPTATATARQSRPPLLGATPFGRIASLIQSVGHPTLCPVSNISPSDQGGTSTIVILSYSQTERCDPRSTAHQGVLYLDRLPTAADARYLLKLASVTSAFTDGWRSGDIAVMLGDGTSVAHQLEAYKGLEGHARLAFHRIVVHAPAPSTTQVPRVPASP